MYNKELVKKIDEEIEKRSLLKHPFYQMWSNGKLTIDHLKGYSREYFQLVKAVPLFVKNIELVNSDPSSAQDIETNLREETEHIDLWVRFAKAIGVPTDELNSYPGASKTILAVAKMMDLTTSSFEEAVAAMYAFEAEIPKISRSKIDGLMNFYHMTSEEALRYFEIHEHVDVRHAQVWRDILCILPEDRWEKAYMAAIESLNAQNQLLDSVQEKYVTNGCC